ncbi:hypothetical protein [Glutamicibacter sp. X7]
MTTTQKPVTVLHRLTERDVRYTDAKDDLTRTFAVNFDKHEMTILHDEGLYRHVRFKNPEHGFYQFDLITWPGYLTITGDIGSYTFSRVEDMFTFFTGYINTSYWAQKLQNGAEGGRRQVKKYNEDAFKAWLLQDFWDYSRDLEPCDARQWWETLREEVLDGFVDTSTESTVLEAIDSIRASDVVPYGHYDDVWESAEGWRVYDFHFELCLAAIVTGIRTYKAHKVEGQP